MINIRYDLGDLLLTFDVLGLVVYILLVVTQSIRLFGVLLLICH